MNPLAAISRTCSLIHPFKLDSFCFYIASLSDDGQSVITACTLSDNYLNDRTTLTAKHNAKLSAVQLD